MHMRYVELEQTVEKLVNQFVISLDGRYRSKISDDCLSGLIMLEFNKRYKDTNNTCLEMMFINKESYITYDIACPIFEHLLEHKCKIICNGHHVAQAFSKFINENLNRN